MQKGTRCEYLITISITCRIRSRKFPKLRFPLAFLLDLACKNPGFWWVLFVDFRAGHRREKNLPGGSKRERSISCANTFFICHHGNGTRTPSRLHPSLIAQRLFSRLPPSLLTVYAKSCMHYTENSISSHTNVLLYARNEGKILMKQSAGDDKDSDDIGPRIIPYRHFWKSRSSQEKYAQKLHAKIHEGIPSKIRNFSFLPNAKQGY